MFDPAAALGLKTAKQQAIKTAEVVAEKTYVYTDQVIIGHFDLTKGNIDKIKIFFS